MNENRNNEKFSPVLYLFVRTDIPDLNPGKLGAQTAHAANEFGAIAAHEMEIDTNYDFTTDYELWCGSRAFGTTITLAATNEEIVDITSKITFSGYVHDDTYPITNWLGETYVTPMDTVGWAFPVTFEEYSLIRNSGLNLHR